MHTKQYPENTVLIRDCPVISVRLPKETYEKVKTLSKRQHRGIGAQCAVFIERELALEETADESRA